MLARCHETPEETPWGCLSWGAGPVQVSIDPNGNLATQTEGTDNWTYTWNAENQLAKVEKNGAEVARFAYDPKGRRVEKVAGGVTTSYTYEGEDILREVRGGTTLRYVHGRGVDEPLAVDDGTAQSHFHADGLGSIVRMSNAAGATTLTRQYDAWGGLEVGASESGPAFTGREWDPETQLYYYRARYYDPRLGRFLSEDPLPLGLRPGNELNPYVYVAGNPASEVDPSGLMGGGLVIVVGCSPDPLTKAFVAALLVLGVAVTIVEICCRDDADDDERDCEAQREEDEERCRRQYTSGGMRSLCWQNAMDRYSDCLRGRPPRPLFPID